MTKPILFLLLLLCSTPVANAQKIRYSDRNNQWISYGNKYWGAASCGYTRYRQYTTDTVVNGKTLTAMTDLFKNDSTELGCGNFTISNTYYYVREDTTTGFVYYWSWGLDTTVDHVLYNYNLHTGDTFTFNGDLSVYGALPPYGVTPDSVMSMDSLLINGVYHKKWVLGCAIAPYTGGLMYTVIEGIGSVVAPYAPFHLDCMNNSEFLGCFTHNGIAPVISTDVSACYTSSLLTFSNSAATCTALSVQDIPALNDKILLYPNPAHDMLVIAKASKSDVWNVDICNIQGAEVYHSSFASSASELNIDLAWWPEGIYIVTVRSDDGNVQRQKITVIH